MLSIIAHSAIISLRLKGREGGIGLHVVIRSSVLITKLASLPPVCSLPPLQSAHERKSVMQCRVYNSVNELKVSRRCDFNSIVRKEILNLLIAQVQKLWRWYDVCDSNLNIDCTRHESGSIYSHVGVAHHDCEILLHCLNLLPLLLYLGPRGEAVCDGEDVWAQSAW